MDSLTSPSPTTPSTTVAEGPKLSGPQSHGRQPSDQISGPQHAGPFSGESIATESTSEWYGQRTQNPSSLPDGNQSSFEFDPTLLFTPSSFITNETDGTPVSPGMMQVYHDRFFAIFHPIMPFINRTRFQSEMTELLPSIEVQALSYAIAMLGTLSMLDQGSSTDHCYEQARSLLDVCERQEDGGSLTNINMLQACILLTLFEFKRPNFARAWMSLGRAIRLVKIMGLDQVGIKPVSENWGLTQDNSLTSEAAPYAEEKRRTFWVLYIFDSFASVRTNLGSAFDESISVPLPSPREYPDFSTSKEQMPSLQQLFEMPADVPLSSFAATNVVIYLYQRCSRHVKSSQLESSYAFWETHHGIEKAIHQCRTSAIAQHLGYYSNEDPLSLALRINLDTVEILLHKAAFSRVERDQLLKDLGVSAGSKCVTGAKDVVEALQLGQALVGNKLEMFRQLGQFLIWPIATSLQVFFSMLSHGEADVTPCINSIRILTGALRDLSDPNHAVPGLLERADGIVAEAEARGSQHTIQT
ncbi:hypothetical protein PG993_011187 [Apiospora rasikravindrae]|uniref:Xylanolytic transcriptional activator regulatory domain-containing protein n=1 Tax=Apiospora rasikravindrae TaxID=990691 RepID=A0ABR1SDU8_9PEZI